MPLPLIAPSVFTAVFSGSSFTGAGVAAGVTAGTAAGTPAGAAGIGVSIWLFLKKFFGVGGAIGAGTTGAAVATKARASKAVAGKTVAAPKPGATNMLYTDVPFLPPIPLPNPLAHLPPLDPVKKAYINGTLTGATVIGATAVLTLSKSSNENNDTPNTANNNSSPVTENDRRRRRQNQRPEPFSESTCAICLEEMSDVNNIVFNYGHRFHADCFLNYSRTQNNSVVCPVCRESDIM